MDFLPSFLRSKPSRLDDDDFYITLLKFVEDRTNRGQIVGFTEILERVYTVHPKIEYQVFKRIAYQALEARLIGGSGSPGLNGAYGKTSLSF